MEQFSQPVKLLLNISYNTFQSLLLKHIIYSPGYCFYVCCDVKEDIFTYYSIILGDFLKSLYSFLYRLEVKLSS